MFLWLEASNYCRLYHVHEKLPDVPELLFTLTPVAFYPQVKNGGMRIYEEEIAGEGFRENICRGSATFLPAGGIFT